MLTCPLGASLLWVRIWVKRFSGKSQNSSPNFLTPKKQEKVLKSCDFRTFYGCGGRTRTYDLRVMSPKNGFLHRFILFKKSLYRNGFSDLSFYPVVCNNSTFYSEVELLLNLNQHPKGKEKPPSYCRTAFPKGEHMSCADCAK